MRFGLFRILFIVGLTTFAFQADTIAVAPPIYSVRAHLVSNRPVATSCAVHEPAFFTHPFVFLFGVFGIASLAYGCFRIVILNLLALAFATNSAFIAV